MLSYKVRIAFVTETWAPAINGIVTRLQATIRELRRGGHEVLVLAPTDSDADLQGIEVRTVPALGLPFVYGGQPWGLPLPRSRRFLEGFDPDVIHAVSPVLLGWAGVVFARTHGLPLVCSYHTHVARYAHFYGLGFLEQPIWAVITQAHLQAHVNLAASPASRRELESQGVPDVRVWRGGVDLDRFHPARADTAMRERLTAGHPERRLLLCVGRLAAEKGLDQLLALAPPGSDRHLALVGDGPARAELEMLFRDANATFTGPLVGEELAAAYASSDLFVFPSTTDTFGLVLLEAMASGLPVLAASSRPSAELLAGAPAAALFSPGGEAEMIGAADRLLATPADRMALADHARRRAPTWEQTTTELLTHYESAIAINRGLSRGVSA
jgi:glycosyltransferase involved in cell wall biosynthesis